MLLKKLGFMLFLVKFSFEPTTYKPFIRISLDNTYDLRIKNTFSNSISSFQSKYIYMENCSIFTSILNFFIFL